MQSLFGSKWREDVVGWGVEEVSGEGSTTTMLNGFLKFGGERIIEIDLSL